MRHPRSRCSRLRLAGAIAVLAVAAMAVPAAAPGRPATSAGTFSPPPTIVVTAPSSPLRGLEGFTAKAAASSGETISSIIFEYSVAGANSWTQFGPSATVSPATAYLDTTALANGVYDFQAVVTDSQGNTGTFAVTDLTVANNATYIALASPGSPLSAVQTPGGKVTITATAEPGGATPDTVTFGYCLTSEDCPSTGSWRTLATAPPSLDSDGNPTGNYVTSLDTSALADGKYDFAVSGQDGAGDPFQGGAITAIQIDNTPPDHVTLIDPGGPLSALVNLTASASDPDLGTGVASVHFEVSRAGTGDWTAVAVASAPSSPGAYSASFDTRQLADGTYDLRVEATDGAGNITASPTVAGVAIANPGTESFNDLSLTDYAAPATNVTLLGELPGAQHESWALGQSNAPPPAGLANDYTAEGAHQLVVLRYTDATGWEIVDVLRNADGSPYPIVAGGAIAAHGEMTASGEAWIELTDSGLINGQNKQVFAVFHRLPGGPFELDSSATATLAPLKASSVLRLSQAPDGSVSGGVFYSESSSGTAVQSELAPTPGGQVAVQVSKYSQLELVNGSWEWSSPQPIALPPSYSAPSAGTTLTVGSADVTGPGTGWAALQQRGGLSSMVLATFDPSGWRFFPTGLDALDGTGEFASGSQESVSDGNRVSVTPVALSADSTGVWVSATVGAPGVSSGSVVARYDSRSNEVVDSWCTNLPRTSHDCANRLDSDHPAAAPDALFDPSQGPVADALSTTSQQVGVFSYGSWTSIPTPGFSNTDQSQRPASGEAVFADPTDGWLAGANTLGQLSAAPSPSPLAVWPAATQDPLLSVALPPGPSNTDTAGAIAVGLKGTALHYDPSAGWQVDPTPPRARNIALTGVAFAGASLAFAVGQVGTILRWDGTAWSQDPQSGSVTTATLNAVAFDSAGEGWAVGGFGTILHYDGNTWSPDQIDSADAGKDITSVAIAGSEVFAIAGGNLIERSPGGTWGPVPTSDYPNGVPPASGSLRLVSGLSDGGAAVAGASTLMLRQAAGQPFAYAPQSFSDIPVALAAFRDPRGNLQAFLSIAPPIATSNGRINDLGGFPSGDGDLILQTDSGWKDLGRDLPPAENYSAAGDGVVHADPVLAVASSPDGAHAWAVGGWAGTHAADGVGTDDLLSARPVAWFTSAIWRYDAGGSMAPPSLTQAQGSLPASVNTVSFAFFSSALCKQQCAGVQDAQPDVNLRAAATQIAAFAQQPGGPAFAMLGGNARGPIDSLSYARGSGALDLAHLSGLLSPLSSLPTYAAYGSLDADPASSDPALPWAEAFASAPAPFGSGAAPAGITAQGSGDPTAGVHKYYAFDVGQNGGTLRAIVLDNSAGSLEGSAPGQSTWLSNELGQAQSSGLPVVVFAARPLNSNDLGTASDGDAIAAQLAAAGVLAVFTTSGAVSTNSPVQQDQVAQVPANAASGAPQIPEYEGATLTYQQPKNNGVLWYDVSVDTAARTVRVDAVPVISSLALEPLKGLTVSRSSTLAFAGIGRRPRGTIATTPVDSNFPGYPQYVGIPASSCSGCIGPSYAFTSSNPVVGDFVAPSAPGSPFPKLTGEGKTIHSSTSGLFCAFNGGTTTVSVTSGLLTSSLPVTVQAGGYGPPCGTVPGGSSTNVIHVPGGKIVGTSTTPAPGAPVPPPGQVQINPATPKLHLPAPPPLQHAPATQARPVSAPSPAGLALAAPFAVAPTPTLASPPVVPPLVPPALTPVPPGGATVSAQAAAKREEKARQQARQSAYVTRPSGVSATEWFYPVLATVTVVALLLSAAGLRGRPRTRPAWAEVRDIPQPPRHGRKG